MPVAAQLRCAVCLQSLIWQCVNEALSRKHTCCVTDANTHSKPPCWLLASVFRELLGLLHSPLACLVILRGSWQLSRWFNEMLLAQADAVVYNKAKANSLRARAVMVAEHLQVGGWLPSLPTIFTHIECSPQHGNSVCAT